MEYIKRYIAATIICQRYGMWFVPIFSKKVKGHVAWKGVVGASLFSENFWEIFWHEIGHIIDFKIRGMYNTKRGIACIYTDKVHFKHYPLPSVKTNNLVSCEVQATRFAFKMLKKTGRYTDKSRDMLLGKAALASYFLFNDDFPVSIYAKAVRRTGAKY